MGAKKRRWRTEGIQRGNDTKRMWERLKGGGGGGGKNNERKWKRREGHTSKN